MYTEVEAPESYEEADGGRQVGDLVVGEVERGDVIEGALHHGEVAIAFFLSRSLERIGKYVPYRGDERKSYKFREATRGTTRERTVRSRPYHRRIGASAI